MHVVLWDIDNTLFDYRHIDDVATSFVLDAIERDLGPEQGAIYRSSFYDVVENIRHSHSPLHHHKELYWKTVFQHSHIDISLTDVHRYTVMYEDTFLQQLKAPFEGVETCLRRIIQQGGKNIALSNNRYRYQLARLDKLRLLPFFATLFCFDEMGYSKPDPHIWTFLASQLPPCDSVMAYIGDSWKEDILFARQHGIPHVFWKHNDEASSHHNDEASSHHNDEASSHHNDEASSHHNNNHNIVYRFASYMDLVDRLDALWTNDYLL